MKRLAIVLLLAPGAAAQQVQPGTTPSVERKQYDMRELAAAAVQPAPVDKGRRLWVQRCAHCHDPQGQPSAQPLGPPLDAATLKSRGDEAVRQTIVNGSTRMPAFRYALRPPQIDDLITFLKTVPANGLETR